MTDTTLHPRAPALARLSSPAVVRTALLLYGLVLAGWSVNRFDASIPDQATLMESRRSEAERAQRTLATGGPPLLACVHDYDESRPLEDCYPAGTTDDQGIYLYLPLFAEATGIESPELALKWLYITLFALLAFLAPLIFYALFNSLVAGLFAGAAITFHFDVFANTDIYWVSVWCYLIAVPLLLLVYKRWSGYRSLAALAGVVAIGSFATTVRIHAGLPILLGALIVAFLRRRGLLGLVAAGVVLALAYLSFGFVVDGVREYRDHVVGDPGLSEKYPTRHPFWHNAYIGLGYLPNPYGIEWNDSVAADFVKRQNPEAAYLSPEYERTLRDEYFRIARTDPGFIRDNLLTKTGLAFDAARDRFGIVLILAPLALFFGRSRREWRRYLLIASPTLVISLPPPVLTMPWPEYQLSWLGAWATLWLLLACWAIAVLPRELSGRLEERSLVAQRLRNPGQLLRDAGLGLARSRALWLALALIATVVVFADVVGPRAARAAEDYDFWRTGAAALVPEVSGLAVREWHFDHGLPPDWAPISAAGTEPAGSALKVTTNDARFEYQIVSPAVRLPAGTYDVRARLDVVSGGLELGALNVTENAWIKTTHYWHGQTGFATRDLSTTFSLTASTDVRIILSNWHARSRQSIWIVRRVWIRRA